MTAEIAIMNRQAIVLAADSAVTVGRQKVWKTANKLFSLSPYNDIAIMAYGSGDFVGFPWETIIKSFRLHVGNKKYETVQHCADDFMDYLRCPLFTRPMEEEVSIMMGFIATLEKLQKRVTGYNNKSEFRSKLLEAIKTVRETTLTIREIGIDLPFRDFKTRYESIIAKLSKDIFKEHVPLTILKTLEDFLHVVFLREVSSDVYSGIVVAGFGSNEFFPSLISYRVDGKDRGALRAWKDPDHSHDCNDDSTSGVIIPFGQADIAILFLEGISARHTRWVRRAVKRILDDKSDSVIDAYVNDANERTVERSLQRKENAAIVKNLDKEFDDYRDRSLVQPVMKVVATLPKEEMADMAEALVELTSLRRRVDSPLESVGGPTDVAVISKGDGLVWIKRKHYFDPALNSDFYSRKSLQIQEVRDAE